MPKYWGKQIFTHGRFPEVGEKQKAEGKQKKKKKRLNDGNNNGQAMHGGRKPPVPKSDTEYMPKHVIYRGYFCPNLGFPPFLGIKEYLDNVFAIWTTPRRLYFCYLGKFKIRNNPDDYNSAGTFTFRGHFPLLSIQKPYLEINCKIRTAPVWL